MVLLAGVNGLPPSFREEPSWPIQVFQASINGPLLFLGLGHRATAVQQQVVRHRALLRSVHPGTARNVHRTWGHRFRRIGIVKADGDVAQLVEHLLCKQGVGGSSPLVSTRVIIVALTSLQAARAQMAVSLGFHIVFAALAVGLPAMLLFAEYRANRTGDACLDGAVQAMGAGARILVAVGAVSGTVAVVRAGALLAGADGAMGRA